MSARLERIAFHAVGTTCAAAVSAGPYETRRAQRALSAARAEVAECEEVLSRFLPTSDLCRLNAAAGEWTAVDERLLELLRLSLRAREETNGRFDPTILPALAAAGYDRSFEQLVERPARLVPHWRAGAAIELDLAAGLARLEAGAAVDLGGIGKGYIAERALNAMRDAWPTVPGGFVDLGGDLALRGSPPGGSPWRVAVADPRRPGTSVGVLLLDSGGIATSGRDVRRFGPDRSLHHLIDPATGQPAEPGPLSVTVIAPDGAEAEAHATALAISPAAYAAAHVARHPRISAVFVPYEGEPILLGRPPLVQSRLLVKAA